jgi:hypothetical protein
MASKFFLGVVFFEGYMLRSKYCLSNPAGDNTLLGRQLCFVFAYGIVIRYKEPRRHSHSLSRPTQQSA